jgi:hypothetical protein
MVKKSLMICLIGLMSIAAKAETYYVDSFAGNDQLSGQSETQAWRSLQKVNATKFMPGDRVLFKRGGIWHGQLVPKGNGTTEKLLIFSAYGKGALPVIAADGKFQDAVLLKNISNLLFEFFDISNTDTLVQEQNTGPVGVRILSEDTGTISNIRLSGLYIHDINGDNKKGSKEGNGIFWDCRGPKPSNIENLVIENCRLLRVDRNGIRGNGTFAFRNNWFPNKNLVIRGCTLEDIGGDGIVIKAFDGALVERNKLFYTRTRAKDNAVGIWPHSSDNTVIQYNEVAYTKNVNWANDGQSFDIDGNCNHTIIQNNYSHDNEGGFMLVISDAIDEKSRMTTNNIIRNNLSVNDGNNRRRLFNFALVTDHTHVYGNIFYNQSAEPFKMELIDIEHGIPKDIVFEDNLFLYRGGVIGIFTKSAEQYRAVTWENNVFKGNIKGKSNLLQVTEAKATSVSSKNLNEYPWMFLKSLNLKN